MKQDNRKPVGFHIPKLNGDIHAQIKVAAATEGISMQQWVIEAIKTKLSINKKGGERRDVSK